jgi:hypothetical protein
MHGSRHRRFAKALDRQVGVLYCRPAVVTDDLALRLLLLAAPAASGAAAYLYQQYFGSEAIMRRSLGKAARVRVADVPDGAVVKLVGRAQAVGRPLHSPARGQPCFFFETVVYEPGERAAEEGSGFAWRERARETKSTDFLVEDETGRALVRAASWLVVSSNRRVVTDFAPSDGAPPELVALLERRGLLRPSAAGGPLPLRAVESVLAPGDRVEVIGLARWGLDPDAAGYRAGPKRLALEVPPDGPLLASLAPETA